MLMAVLLTAGLVSIIPSCSEKPLSSNDPLPNALNRSSPSTGTVVGTGNNISADGMLSINIPLPPPPHNYREHLFYIGSQFEGTVKIFSADDRAFVDSLYFPSSDGVRIEVIGRNEKLLVNTSDGCFLYDLRTGRTSHPFGNAAEATISPDCKMVILQLPVSNPYYKRLELRRFDTFQLIYQDSICYGPEFSMDSRYISYSLPITWPNWPLVTYDILENRIVERVQKRLGGQPLAIVEVVPIGSRGKTYSYGLCNGIGILAVSDFGSNDVRPLMTLPENEAYFIPSNDEARLFVTTPPPAWGYPCQKIYIYDVATEIQTAVITISNHEPFHLTASFDGRYLITGSAMPFWNNIALIDLRDAVQIGSFLFSKQNSIFPYNIATRSWRRGR